MSNLKKGIQTKTFYDPLRSIVNDPKVRSSCWEEGNDGEREEENTLKWRWLSFHFKSLLIKFRPLSLSLSLSLSLHTMASVLPVGLQTAVLTSYTNSP
jgi:hypothetical protein